MDQISAFKNDNIRKRKQDKIMHQMIRDCDIRIAQINAHEMGELKLQTEGTSFNVAS